MYSAVVVETMENDDHAEKCFTRLVHVLHLIG